MFAFVKVFDSPAPGATASLRLGWGLGEIGQSFWVKKIKMKPDFLGSAAKEATLSG
jgi:hypothetical protein